MKVKNVIQANENLHSLKAGVQENTLSFSQGIRGVLRKIKLEQEPRQLQPALLVRKKELERLRSVDKDYPMWSLKEVANELYEKWYGKVKGYNKYMNILTAKVSLSSGKQYYYIINSGKDQKVLNIPDYNKILISYLSTAFHPEALFLEYIEHYNLIEDIASIQIYSVDKFCSNPDSFTKNSFSASNSRYRFMQSWSYDNGFLIKDIIESDYHFVKFEKHTYAS